MKHIVAAAYKDALHGLRKDMAQRMMGHPDDDDEEEGEMGDTPEGMHPQAKSDAAEGELGLHPPEEAPEEDRMTDEEKRARMYGMKRPAPKHVAIVIAAGKMAKAKGRK